MPRGPALGESAPRPALVPHNGCMTRERTSVFPAVETPLRSCTPPLVLGPLDGRYRHEAAPLVDYLSEAALNRARIHVEVEWLIFLAASGVLPLRPLADEEAAYLRSLVTGFDSATIAALAETESVTRHDVKAVEYLIRDHMSRAGDHLGSDTILPRAVAAVHIFCTSEDINNLAYAVTIKAAIEEVWLPAARTIVDRVDALARSSASIPMLAHTHGQPATPVTMGKEMAVFAHRLTRQLERVADTSYLGKINGATGTWAAHLVSCPDADWPSLAREFVTSLGLDFNPLTTQIESHDWQAELYADVARFNRIAHNLSTDCWTYISLGYFHQNLAAQGSTGSSTMPHKVNPIRFENAEANFEISSALLDTLAQTLVTSRLQRDLTDSTTQRNIGVALGHSLLALTNLTRGLDGIDVDAARLAKDLDENWEVLGEAIQQVMRVCDLAGVAGMDNPYERLKDLTRGRRVDGDAMRDFIRTLGLPKAEEARLLELTPATYIGYSREQACRDRTGK